MYKNLVFLFLFAISLVSCNTKKLEIKNPDLSDKVKACGGGIGLSEPLNAHITNLHRDLPTDLLIYLLLFFFLFLILTLSMILFYFSSIKYLDSRSKKIITGY